MPYPADVTHGAPVKIEYSYEDRVLLLVLLEPVLNPIWTFLLAGERPGPWALAGGALILGATVWRTVQPLRLRASP